MKQLAKSSMATLAVITSLTHCVTIDEELEDTTMGSDYRASFEKSGNRSADVERIDDRIGTIRRINDRSAQIAVTERVYTYDQAVPSYVVEETREGIEVITMDGYNGTDVFVYYGHVANAPGVLLLHGYGGTAIIDWVQMWNARGYSALTLDMRGKYPTYPQAAWGIATSGTMPTPGPNQHYGTVFNNGGFWHTYAAQAAISAHSLLRARIDDVRTAIHGVSWGGVVAAIVGHDDPRSSGIAYTYTSGFLTTASSWLDGGSFDPPVDAAEWYALWDPSVHIPWIAVPQHFVFSQDDTTFYYATWDDTVALARTATSQLYPHLDHNSQVGAEDATIIAAIEGWIPL